MSSCAELIDVCDGCENFPIYLSTKSKAGELFKDFQYVCCNIPGPGMDTSPFEDSLDGCTCSSASCETGIESTCSCQKFGGNYSDEGLLQAKALSCDNTVVVQECNSNCTCSVNCKNRVVQHGIRMKCEVTDYEAKGLGVRTLQSLQCGKFVCEYAGEVLPEVEVTKRRVAMTKGDANYIFSLREHIGDRLVSTFIDPTYRGNIGRFINHSCEPNLAIVPVRVFNMVPRICLFASRDIVSGEELTYDYCQNEASDMGNDGHGGENANRTQCLCGSQNCRNVLPFSFDST